MGNVDRYEACGVRRSVVRGTVVSQADLGWRFLQYEILVRRTSLSDLFGLLVMVTHTIKLGWAEGLGAVRWGPLRSS